jgi:ribosomal protein L7/L12
MPKSFAEIIPALTNDYDLNGQSLLTLTGVHAALTGGTFDGYNTVSLRTVARIAELTFDTKAEQANANVEAVRALPETEGFTHQSQMEGKYITIIKALRTARSLGLKEAKDAVDAFKASLLPGSPKADTRSIEAIIAKVRELAEEEPDHVYQRVDNQCLYVHKSGEGDYIPDSGCIIGQAAVRAGFTYDEVDHQNTSAWSLVGGDHLNLGGSDEQVRWLGAVQSEQDCGTPWSRAVMLADKNTPLV